MDLSTVLSTLAQVSATLAALIGFLGLWKLDGLEREEGRVEHELRQLMSRDTDVGDHWAFVMPRHELLEMARGAVAGTPNRDGNPRNEAIIKAMPRIKCKLNRLECTLPSDQKWLKRSLVGFLLLALVILVVTFCGLVNTHGGLRVAAILVLSVGTAYMVAEAGGCFSKYRRHQGQ